MLLLVVTLAACSSSLRAAPSLQSTVEAYTAAFGRGDGATAWAIVSKRCKATTTETNYRAIVAAAGVKYPGLHVTTYFEQVDDGSAIVGYGTNALSYREQAWTLESGGWRYDDC